MHNVHHIRYWRLIIFKFPAHIIMSKKSRRSKGHLPNYESIHLLFVIHTILCVKGFINFILIQKILGNDILCHWLQIRFRNNESIFSRFFSWASSHVIVEILVSFRHQLMLNFCEIEFKHYFEFYYYLTKMI